MFIIFYLSWSWPLSLCVRLLTSLRRDIFYWFFSLIVLCTVHFSFYAVITSIILVLHHFALTRSLSISRSFHTWFFSFTLIHIPLRLHFFLLILLHHSSLPFIPYSLPFKYPIPQSPNPHNQINCPSTKFPNFQIQHPKHTALHLKVTAPNLLKLLYNNPILQDRMCMCIWTSKKQFYLCLPTICNTDLSFEWNDSYLRQGLKCKDMFPSRYIDID